MQRYCSALASALPRLDLIRLDLGDGLPWLATFDGRQSSVISLEIDLHNAALDMTIAGSARLPRMPAMAAATRLYGSMGSRADFFGAAFAALIKRMGWENGGP